MVESGLNANHLMITYFTRDHKVDRQSMKDVVFTLNEQINFLQSQIYDIQNQVFEYEARFNGMLSYQLQDSRDSRFLLWWWTAAMEAGG